MEAINLAKRTEIREAQKEAVLSRAKADVADAKARSMILESVAVLGGAPGADGVCLICGRLVPAGESHRCDGSSDE